MCELDIAHFYIVSRWRGVLSSATELPHTGLGADPVIKLCVLGGVESACRRSHALHPGSDAVSCERERVHSELFNNRDAWHLNMVS